MEVREYQTANGKAPFSEWLNGLRDRVARARIAAREDRLWPRVPGVLRAGWKDADSAAVWDIKPTQSKDLEVAHAYWKDYKARTR